MSPLKVCIEIEAPAPLVWPLIAEFEYWPEWGPSVLSVETAAKTVAPGVTGRVKTVLGIHLPFEITRVDRGRSWTWSVAGIVATGHTVEPLSAERCVVCFSVSRLLAPYGWVLKRGLREVKRLAEDP